MIYHKIHTYDLCGLYELCGCVFSDILIQKMIFHKLLPNVFKYFVPSIKKYYYNYFSFSLVKPIPSLMDIVIIPQTENSKEKETEK